MRASEARWGIRKGFAAQGYRPEVKDLSETTGISKRVRKKRTFHEQKGGGASYALTTFYVGRFLGATFYVGRFLAVYIGAVHPKFC